MSSFAKKTGKKNHKKFTQLRGCFKPSLLHCQMFYVSILDPLGDVANQ